jgi:hypothetical protein
MEQQEVKPPKFYNNLKMVLFFCLLLGLAPFFPEPHLWGKIRWVAGGAVGMGLMDWADLLWHGAPWILLIRLGVLEVQKRRKNKAI